jgi:hypothetical protein
MASLLGSVGSGDRTMHGQGSSASPAGLAFGHDLRHGEDTHEKASGVDPSSEGEDDNEIARIARSLSRMSQPGQSGNPFDQPDDSPLNPNSDKFNARAWIKALVAASAPETRRTSGVAWRSLGVHGYSEATDFQHTVSTIGYGAVGALRRLFGNKGRRIQILDGFDGLLKSGEMLVVLGPPGRCARLLCARLNAF